MASITVFEPVSENLPFYVYVLSRGDILTKDGMPTPFYVGMGTARRSGRRQRIDDHEAAAAKGRSGRRSSVIRKLAANGACLAKFIDSWHPTSAAAWLREIALIAEIGRADLGAGPLVNSTDGGDGMFNPGAETRARMRASQLQIRDLKVSIGKAHAAASIPGAVEARKRRWREDAGFRDQVYLSTQAGQKASRANKPEIHAAANAVRAEKMKSWTSENPQKMAEINAMGRMAAATWRLEHPEMSRAASAKARAASIASRKKDPEALRARMSDLGAMAAMKRAADLPERDAAISRCMSLIAEHALEIAPISKQNWSKAWLNFEERLLNIVEQNSRGAGA